MALKVNDLYTIQLKFNGQEYPLNPGTIRSIEIIENIKNVLPTIRLELEDATGFLTNELALTDGSICDIEIGDGSGGKLFSGDYHILAVKGEPVSKHMETEIHGMLNHPQYFRKIASGMYEGTSSSVLQRIAGEVGLQAVTDSTNDSMPWLPLQQFMQEFASDVVDHGWAGPSGILIHSVDNKHRLHYRNLAKVITQGPKKKFVYAQNPLNDEILALHYIIDNKQGMMNNMTGYNSVTHQLNFDNIFNTFTKTLVPMISSGAPISAALQGIMGDNRVVFKPTDAGNVHQHYAEAEHTNIKGRATFGIDIRLVTDQFTDLSIFDMVNFNITDHSSDKFKMNKSYSGRWMISGKTMFIQKNKYFEKLELTTQGVN